MLPGIRLTKSEARLLPKRCLFLGGERGSGPSTRPSGEVLAWLLLPKRVFKCQYLYVWKIFLRGGTKSIIVYRLALGMECHVLRSGTRQCDAFGAGILVCVLGGQLFFVQSNPSSNLWLRSLHDAQQITGFTVMGYAPLLLSDKISTSYLPPLLFLRLLTSQSRDASVRFSFVLRLTSPARPSITRRCQEFSALGLNTSLWLPTPATQLPYYLKHQNSCT